MRKRILLLLVFILQISLFHNIFALAEGPENYLKGKFYSSVKDHFLVATEKMRDKRFAKTVIVMLENDENEKTQSKIEDGELKNDYLQLKSDLNNHHEINNRYNNVLESPHGDSLYKVLNYQSP